MGRPFTTFNFHVILLFPETGGVICDAEFSECSGLEMGMDVKTLREGGNNRRQIHLAGPVSYGQLTLKRGMTRDLGLWSWFEKVQSQRRLRASGEIHLLSSDRETVDARFRITGCLPSKLKAPAFAAKDGAVAIEEMQIAYETLTLAAAETADAG